MEFSQNKVGAIWIPQIVTIGLVFHDLDDLGYPSCRAWIKVSSSPQSLIQRMDSAGKTYGGFC